MPGQWRKCEVCDGVGAELTKLGVWRSCHMCGGAGDTDRDHLPRLARECCARALKGVSCPECGRNPPGIHPSAMHRRYDTNR